MYISYFSGCSGSNNRPNESSQRKEGRRERWREGRRKKGRERERKEKERERKRGGRKEEEGGSAAAGMPWHQELEAADHTASTFKRQREMNTGWLTFSYYCAQDPTHGMVPPTLRVGLFISVNPI